ncbi:BTAD domain-containing putative transcriptional regulator [Amycolatopsis nigrescens]|uniref:BTAD domain-containing putative transcriptional regulator n=1 Tax=Amycolatopsis nigrescens TaxID=381445 RepID=UPI0003804CBB|nr:BTAD domain-containing putative transcriptional regulator [Amycolatopsis nigrescens]
MRVALLGPVRAEENDGTPIEIGGARLRMLLARLALDAGHAVSAAALVDGLWGAEPPVDAANALQSLVSRLRRVLGAAAAVDSVHGGYRLAVRPEEVDAHRFERLAARGREELAADRTAEAAAVLAEALGLWRGAALADVLDAPFAAAPATRLADLRAAAAEDRFDAELRLGRHTEVLADLEQAGAEYPLRERLAGLRMRALSAAGRQSEALALYEQVRGTLAEELGVDPSAELRDAHLSVLRGELPRPAPKPQQADAALPVRLTSFVGREDELKLLTELLAGARLVTLVGPGGAGKTRLAVETVVRHPVHERGRVWFVPLAGVRDGGDLPSAVLGALGSWDLRVRDQNHRPPVDVLDRLAELFGGGESVLVLDNCEHVVDAAADLVHQLLGRAPGLRVLATSREPLAITGEALCPLGPLEVPPDGTGVAEVAGAGAVRLFIDRAVTVRPDFRLDESLVAPVVEICRRLDGMPLALELAAARLRSMSAEQIARRLDDRFRLLTSGSRVALPRQRTLRAVVEWSWDLLDTAERVLARRLSVFASAATVAAIEQTCADELLPAEDVLYVLGSLVEKSIVDATAGDGGEPRYRMLETIRVYGAERLDEAGERAAVTGRFCEFFAELAEEYQPWLREERQLRAMVVLDADQENLVHGLRRAIDTGAVALACRLVDALMWYWLMRGTHEQAGVFVGEMLRFKEELPEQDYAAYSALHVLMRSMPGSPPSADVRRIIAECDRTNALERHSALALALPMLAFFSREPELAERQLRRVRVLADPWAQACGYWAESFVLADGGDLVGAERARASALDGFRALGDRWGSAMSLSMQAEVFSYRGQHASAIEAYEEGLRLATELNSGDDLAQQLGKLVIERLRAGDVDGARRDVRRLEELAAEPGRGPVELIVTFTLLEFYRQLGDLERATRLIDRLEELVSSVPFPESIATEWVAQANAAVLISAGDAAGARVRLQVAVAASLDRGDLPDAAIGAESLAKVCRLEGDLTAAATVLGLGAALRGMFDQGSPELRELVTEAKAELGESGYAAAFRLGAELSKEDAAAALLERLSATS